MRTWNVGMPHTMSGVTNCQLETPKWLKRKTLHFLLCLIVTIRPRVRASNRPVSVLGARFSVVSVITGSVLYLAHNVRLSECNYQPRVDQISVS